MVVFQLLIDLSLNKMPTVSVRQGIEETDSYLYLVYDFKCYSIFDEVSSLTFLVNYNYKDKIKLF